MEQITPHPTPKIKLDFHRITFKQTIILFEIILTEMVFFNTLKIKFLKKLYLSILGTHMS